MKLKKYLYKKVESTNNVALRLIKQGNQRGIILTDQQTKGKGQRNNNWISIKGNLFLSVFFEISKKILDCLCKNNPTNLQKLQENILLDKELSYPIQISFDYNIDGNWENKEVNITLNSRITDFDNHNFYALRRQNLIRNQIFVQ